MNALTIAVIIVALIIIGSSIWAINKGYSSKHRDVIDELPEKEHDEKGQIQ